MRNAAHVSRTRLCAALLGLGIGILLVRTIVMLAQGSLAVLVPWVGVLLVFEFLLDSGTFLASVRWWVTRQAAHGTLALRLAAAAILLHAGRVLVFVLGRVGPWIDFDVKSEHRALHAETWSWAGVYFAAAMSLLGVLGVFAVWQYRRPRARPGNPP